MIPPVLSSLNREKILRALQIPAQNPLSDQLNEQISRCEEEVLRCALVRFTIRILPVEEIRPILLGNDILRLLDGCQEAVLMALTLGTALEKLLMREEVTNMSDAYVLDILASLAVEEAADDLERQIKEKVRSEGKYLTNRYSPGYGDFPIEVQRQLLDYLNAGRTIGLTLTPTNLMVPRKSITAVLGISSVPKPDIYGNCIHCPLQTKCTWAERGERCYQS